MKKKGISLLITAVLAGGYLGGAFFFKTHYLPNTIIDDKNYGGSTAATVSKVYEQADLVSVGVIDKNGNDAVINMEDIDYKNEPGAALEDILKKQNEFTWPIRLFRSEQVDCGVLSTYNQELLEQQIDQIPFFNQEDWVEPRDAFIKKNESEFELVPEDDGYSIDKEAAVEIITKSIKNKNTKADITPAFKTASLRSDNADLIKKMDFIKEAQKRVVRIDLTDAEEVLEGSSLIQFFDINDENELIINEKRLKEYVTTLSEKYNTYETKRSFVTAYGNEIEVGGSGNDTYGFQLAIDDTTKILEEAIEKGENCRAKWKIPAKARNMSNGDIGATYVEVSIADQKLWYYKDGDLQLESDIVTGADTESRRTPTGLFRIWSKESPRVLRGEGYATKVTYWMPITWTGVGIHDADWQSSFGGTRYLDGSGSHGCVNTPKDNARALYETVDVDTPVIIY